ncbi:MAG: anion permease [Methylothermaceae bacterium]|nr:anion permease [Methylothermaceae bacterium]
MMKNLAIALAVVAFGTILALGEFGDSPATPRMAAVAAAMSILWISEAIPLAATALLPLILFPPLGISSSNAVAAEYMNSTVFLLVKGFMIAVAGAAGGGSAADAGLGFGGHDVSHRVEVQHGNHSAGAADFKGRCRSLGRVGMGVIVLWVWTLAPHVFERNPVHHVNNGPTLCPWFISLFER